MLLTQNSHSYSSATSRLFQQSQKSIERSVERLASAKRVNSARDDAAGLSIHTRLEQQIRTASKERANLQQQISFTQTAQGTLNEVQDRLMRLREIGVQAANATLNEQDRKSLQSEAEGLLKTIEELAQSEFNQQKIFGRSYTFDTGKTEQNPGGLTRLDLNDLESTSLNWINRKSSSLGVNAFVDWQQGDIRFGQGIHFQHTPQGPVAIGGVDVRATQASDDALSTEYNAGSAIAKAAAINAGTNDHGVSAEVHAATAEFTISHAVNLGNGFEMNGVTFSSVLVAPGEGRDTLVEYLNTFSNQTGVVASHGESNKILLRAEDGRNIIIEANNHGLANQLGFFNNQKPSFQYDKKIVVGGKLSLFSEQDYQLYYDNPIMNESLGMIHSPRPFNRDFIDTRIESGGKMIFHQTGPTQGYPFSNAYTADPNSPIPSFIDRIYANNLRVNDIDSWKQHRSAQMDMDGPLELVYAFENTGYLRQTNYRAFDLPGSYYDGVERDAYIDGIDRVNYDRYADYTLFFSHLEFEFDASKMHLIDMYRAHGTDSVDAFKMSILRSIYYHDNPHVNLLVEQHPGIVQQGLVQMNGDHQEMEVTGIDFESQEGAVASLAIIDRALGEVMANQIDLGALQNSLEHSINRVEQSQSDLTQADERIVSADFAVETAELTRAQIKQGLGQKLLSKVNVDSYLALALVRSGRRNI